MFQTSSATEKCLRYSNTHSYLSLAYGEYDENVLQVAEELGETVITWNFEFVSIVILSYSFFFYSCSSALVTRLVPTWTSS